MFLNQATMMALFTGFKTHFQDGFAGVTPQWQKIATLVTSTTSQESYGWLGNMPELREWLGDRQVKNLSVSNYTIKNKKFEGTVSVKRDNIEDDQTGVYAPLFKSLGYSAAVHPDQLVFGLLQNGFEEKCYDGEPFFSASHPAAAGSVASNFQSGDENPWFLLDVSRPLKPMIFQKRRDYQMITMSAANDEIVFTRDEYRYGVDCRVNVGFGFWQMAYASQDTMNATNFNTAMEVMMSCKSDKNLPLGIVPNLLVCGPTNRATALEVVKSERLANGQSNINRDAVEVLIVPWLK